MQTRSFLAAAGLALALLPCAHAQNETDADANVLERSGETGSDDTAPQVERQARSFAVIGLSRLSADLDNVGDAVNLDVSLGLRGFWWLSLEGVASITVAPGSNDGPRSVTVGGTPCTTPPTPVIDPDGTPDGCDPEATEDPTVEPVPGSTASSNRLQTTNFGVFAVLRSPGRVYGVGKYGYRLINSSVPEIQQGDDRMGTAYTLGAGYRWGVGLSSVEVTYTEWSEQLETVGLSLAYGFGASPGAGAH